MDHSHEGTDTGGSFPAGEAPGPRRWPARAVARLSAVMRRGIYGNATVLALLSLIWLIVRTGRKPSRINYPCQRAALANVTVLLGGAAAPVAARLPRAVMERRGAAPRARSALRLVEVAAALAVAVAIVLTFYGGGGRGGRSMPEMTAAAAALRLPELRSTTAGASDIFIAENVPPASEHGVDYLLQVMSGNGLDFFQSPGTGAAAGPAGLIGKNDVVLIKVNGEWKWRGGTNTDVVKGLVNAIVHHPDGFTGEVVIVENGQWDSYMDNRPDNRNPDACNAQDRGQSFNDVANMFAGHHRVSVYDWTAVQTHRVDEYNSGDGRDGYVYMAEVEVGYPKFTTAYGTRVSLRHGVWNGSEYDNGRLKFLNVPVLKDHGLAGVTNAIKHFMGVQDLWRLSQEPPHEPMKTGFFGHLMLRARYPDLNISDCIWVTPAGGPNAPYDRAVRLDRLIASRDPVALDYYCGKYVLMPVSGNGRHDPDSLDAANNHNFFHQMLFNTRDVLLAGGRQVTTDESRMNVYKGWSPEEPPATPFEYYLAEGCTAYGFETWILVANPGDRDATVRITYLADGGGINKDPVRVPARSRFTVNASADAWAMNAGVRVGSDLPVYVERAMYWGERAEGHDAIGTATGSTEWYLADGHTSDGFETWVEILNPGATRTGASLTYVTPDGPVAGPSLALEPRSRTTVLVNDTVRSGDVSTKVTSDHPVVVERSMYWDARRGGACSNGVKLPSKEWYFAEGATHSGFETWVLLMNPGPGAAKVKLDLMTTGPGDRGRVRRSVSVPAGARRTVRLNDVVDGADVACAVRSDAPVVAERTMLWAVPGGRAGHATVGMTAAAREVFLPEGCTAYGFETWLLLQNPGASESSVTVHAMTSGGEKRIAAVKVAAGARRTLRLNDYYQGNLSIRVAASLPVSVERAVYWNGRSGGTCSIGYSR